MELFWAYVSSGFSGPTGRPISLASFVLNARDWPADPYPFKRTNLILHLLIGGLLFATLRQLLQSIGRTALDADWIALIATALWLLNPFLVSTTLYVVQRMTQLSALFMLLGIWGYLRGRLLLGSRPWLGYSLITLSVGLGTLLAVYSKENGVLLPLLILVMELALWHHWTRPRPDWRWMLILLGVPTLIILWYLLKPVLNAEAVFAKRDFTLAERLWTQPRFLWDYLWHLFVPHIQTQGLYQDGRLISTGWRTPWTTLPALLGVLGLIVGGWLARRRWPLISLAILFFLAGHLLESTTLALEPYFEHRNYLPAVFLFLPVAAGLWSLRDRVKPLILAMILLGWTGSHAFATWQRASLWGDEDALMLVWAQTNPNSPRAQTSAAQVWLRLGHPDRALALLAEASQRMPDSGYLTTNLLAFKLGTGRLTLEELKAGLERIQRQTFDAQMLRGLELLVDTLNRASPRPEPTQVMLNALEGIRDTLDGRIPVAHRFSYYLQGKLMAGQGDGERAYAYFIQALSYYRSTETALNMVSILAMHGHYERALAMLDQAEATLGQEPGAKLKRRRATYEMEIGRLRSMLLEDLNRAGLERHDATERQSGSESQPANT